MAVLILNANTASPITVTVQKIGKGQNRFLGGVTPSANGINRSSVRGQARNIPVMTSYVDTATEAQIQAAIQNGVQINCSGDILANIQTQCTIECVSSDMVPGLSPVQWVMQLNIAEVSPLSVLLKYAPGDTITGEAFTRSTTATYYDANGVLQTSAINAKRDGHYLGGVRSTLLEGSRTNSLTQSEAFDNAAWSKSGVTIGANAATGPDGNATADKIQEDNAVGTTHFVFRNPSTTAGQPQSHSIFAKAAERTWLLLRNVDRDGAIAASWVNLSTGAIGTKSSRHTVRVRALTGSWFRVDWTLDTSGAGGASYFWEAGPSTGDNVTTYTGVTGSGIYVIGGQFEQDQPFSTSYIPTTAAGVTRGADSYSLPFVYPPAEMTLYLKFKECGSIIAGGNARVAFLGSSANGVPQLAVDAVSGKYQADTNNGSVGVTSALSVAPAYDDVVEVVARLYADGSIQITQSVNSGAESSATQSVANALATLWSAQLAWLNSTGSSFVGFNAFQSLKIVAGSRSLTEMRAT